MRVNCLDEGMLQSYMDGELSPEMSAEAAKHLAACAACAGALDAAVAENAFFASAFALDAGVSVPTERLHDRIETAVAELNAPRRSPQRGTIWSFGAIAAWLSAPFNIAPRYAAAFASLLAFVAFAAIFGVVTMRRGDNGSVATTVPGESAPPSVIKDETIPAVENAPQGPGSVDVVDVSGGKSTEPEKRNDRNDNRNERAPKIPQPIDKVPTQLARQQPAQQQSVPGEEEYLRSIASLTKVVEVSGGSALPPKFRTEYERNIAVIDRAIEETRAAAIRNPKDTEASAFLFSAYQNKLDLLSRVVDQTQVATLNR